MKRNVSLKEYSTFKIGGEAKYLLEPKTTKELIKSVQWAKDNDVAFFVLGGGSNILISDDGFDGLVIISKMNKFEIKGNKVTAEAGVKLVDLIDECLKKKLSGLEWASGIPKATIGGSLYMNAGAFGSNMADIVKEVVVLDTSDLKIKTFSFKECQFDYKDSVFRGNKSLIIISCLLVLEEKQDIEEEVKRISIYRKENHPVLFPSAGSIFKNPFNISAGEAIEKTGLKGKKIGGAMVSDKHANFIINVREATSNDVKQLIDLIKKQVKEKLNIDLEEEIQYLGY